METRYRFERRLAATTFVPYVLGLKGRLQCSKN